MKNTGKASLVALRLIGLTGGTVVMLLAVAFLAKVIGSFVLDMTWILLAAWVLFAAFSFVFFRDPDPMVPTAPNLVISPAHGKVDTIDTVSEAKFMGGKCRRISIFLSVIDVHVQCAPVAGRIAYLAHTPGQYLNAMRTDSAQFNENVLIGLDCAEPRGEHVGVRLIAGMIARRIVPWIQQNESVQRGERISLIQFGSRVDVYLSERATLKVKPGDKVVGGETILAAFD